VAALASGLAAAAARANVDAAPAPAARPASLAIIPVDPSVYDAPVPAEEGEAAAPAPRRDGPPVAVLKGLDKFSGLARAFEAPIGGAAAFDRLTVAVSACRPGGPAGAAAFLTIVDGRAPGAPAFQGWMFAESPALSALDHPRYDVWVLSCSTASGEAS
jgi:hypothetical protein